MIRCGFTSICRVSEAERSSLIDTRVCTAMCKTYITTAIKVARKWAAPRPWCLSSGTRSVGKRLISPLSGNSAVLIPSIKQRLWSHPTCWRYINKIIIIIIIIMDWTVCCDWLQLAGSRIMLYTHHTVLMRAARFVQVLQDLLQVFS